MLHATFQNITCLPHFGVRLRVFFNTFDLANFEDCQCGISVPCPLTLFGYHNGIRHGGMGRRSVSVAATEMSLSMGIHTSYSSFSIPSES
ncbi:hypothetical protein AVEN_145879-1 [Araneus ventricosus]|uniref:Uncharacterized protein n=1 Tax=Araneus ventricosus TaxID=182803 RepID=A0A4Y2IHM2_ARAVE|nr:hypothetical protein AVEN_145879-1 [Araneus ventricosus]